MFNNLRVGSIRCVSVTFLLVVASLTAHAEIREWRLADRLLQGRTTAALQRYYTFTKPDSLRLRYLRTNAGVLTYRFRAHLTNNDSLGQLLSVRLGQLMLSTTSTMRIALGDDLYEALLRSRLDAAAEERTVIEGDGNGHDDWERDYRLIAALDRVDVRITPGLRGFAALGARESNLYWWSDGTARVGISSPEWEFAVLLPLASGGVAIGPFRERRLAPAYGAAASARIGEFSARVRVAAAGDRALDSTLSPSPLFIHSLSAQASYTLLFSTGAGTFRGDLGIGYEEFDVVGSDRSLFQFAGEVRRLSPVIDIGWTNPEEYLHARIGMADLALRGSISARLSRSLWLELRAVSNDIFRDSKSFEHPFYLFITPRVKF